MFLTGSRYREQKIFRPDGTLTILNHGINRPMFSVKFKDMLLKSFL